MGSVSRQTFSLPRIFYVAHVIMFSRRDVPFFTSVAASHGRPRSNTIDVSLIPPKSPIRRPIKAPRSPPTQLELPPTSLDNRFKPYRMRRQLSSFLPGPEELLAVDDKAPERRSCRFTMLSTHGRHHSTPAHPGECCALSSSAPERSFLAKRGSRLDGPLMPLVHNVIVQYWGAGFHRWQRLGAP